MEPDIKKKGSPLPVKARLPFFVKPSINRRKTINSTLFVVHMQL